MSSSSKLSFIRKSDIPLVSNRSLQQGREGRRILANNQNNAISTSSSLQGSTNTFYQQEERSFLDSKYDDDDLDDDDDNDDDDNSSDSEEGINFEVDEIYENLHFSRSSDIRLRRKPIKYGGSWVCACPEGKNPTRTSKNDFCLRCKDRVLWKCVCGNEPITKGSRWKHVNTCKQWNLSYGTTKSLNQDSLSSLPPPLPSHEKRTRVMQPTSTYKSKKSRISDVPTTMGNSLPSVTTTTTLTNALPSSTEQNSSELLNELEYYKNNYMGLMNSLDPIILSGITTLDHENSALKAKIVQLSSSEQSVQKTCEGYLTSMEQSLKLNDTYVKQVEDLTKRNSDANKRVQELETELNKKDLELLSFRGSSDLIKHIKDLETKLVNKDLQLKNERDSHSKEVNNLHQLLTKTIERAYQWTKKKELPQVKLWKDYLISSEGIKIDWDVLDEE